MSDTDGAKRAPRRGGPQSIFFGGDDAREMWTWDCRFPHGRGVRTFDDVPTWEDAARELREHHRMWHGRRGRHACPRCGAPVQNRAGDPERTDLCPPCTAALWQGSQQELENRLSAVLNLAGHWTAAQKANRESLERGELAVLHVPTPSDFELAATGCLEVPEPDRPPIGLGTPLDEVHGMFFGKQPVAANGATQ